MSNNRRANRHHRNARNQGEASAFNRLAAILERHTTPPLAASITNNYVSIGTLNILKKSKSETPTEPRTEEPKRKKFKSAQNYAITTPTPPANPNYTYSTQPLPKPTPIQTNTPPLPRKGYTGPHPLCQKCNFHHLTNTSCRLCTSCNRLGHFAMNCRTNPTPISSIAPTPYITNTQPARSCYQCGDPTHFKNACPNLRITPAPQPDHNRVFTPTTAQAQVRPPNQLTAPTVPTPQQNQAPEFYDSVMNS